MDDKHKVIGIMGLIALRKSELFYKLVSELSKEKKPSEKDKEKIKKYISNLNNERLLTKKEKENKKINPSLKLKDLELDFKKLLKDSIH